MVKNTKNSCVVWIFFVPLQSKMQTVVKNTARLFSANVIAQALGLIVYPILTRMYSPEDFGVFNHYTSVCGILVTLSTLELYNAVVLPKSDREAFSIVRVACLPMMALVVLLALTIPFKETLTGWLQMPDLSRFYWLLPISVLAGGMWNLLNYWYIRRNAYARISGYQLSQASFTSGYKLLFGFSGWTTWGLIVSSVAAQICSLGLSLSLSWKKHLRPLFTTNDTDEHYSLADTWRKYRNFPRYSFPRSIVNYVFGQLPVLVLAPVFGTRLIGFWGMALLLAFTPISTITRSLYQSLYEYTTAKVHARQHIASYFYRFARLVLLISVPGFTALYFILPWLTGLLLGDEWTTTGQYIRWMLPWLLCSLLTASTGFIADIFFRQKIGLYFELLMALLRTAGVIAGVVLNSFEIAIIGYSIGSAVACGAQFVWLLSLVRGYEKSLE